ncbi:flagellar biosynthetic protein FliR [Marinibactrum halimedae]|uniref:Flagellar biosynthetic protein FliR n=1 Tax=Marinibactrum halimedae TaxID=1444977 RepID=A0AA37T6R0_9GAMM|nr:flagellar biosynthetic protein FliR [Marinibactrum halimedae]MCD9459144.1 flagellar biosynthetic protein FliR [Marinibactrum halimedae]GLS24746.1 flagellar biosynthetic protein FliR [Marinibactrum halimedae]
MVELSDLVIQNYVSQIVWPFIRIGSFLMAVPFFGARTISPRFRIAIAFPLAMSIGAVIPPVPNISPLSLEGFSITLSQVVIGGALGFIFQIYLQLFVLAGQIIAMKMGLGFASMNDPSNGVTVTVLSQFYLTLSTLLLLSINGHLLLIEMIALSFTTFPIGSAQFLPDDYFEIIKLASWMFAGGLVLSLPVVTAIMIVNLAFGVMSRAAPQMNVFAVGFPITLVFGMLLMWVGLTNFLPQFSAYTDDAFIFVRELISP